MILGLISCVGSNRVIPNIVIVTVIVPVAIVLVIPTMPLSSSSLLLSLLLLLLLLSLLLQMNVFHYHLRALVSPLQAVLQPLNSISFSLISQPAKKTIRQKLCSAF